MKKLLIGGMAASAAITLIMLAPPASADPGQADLSRTFAQAGAPFVGSWHAHGEGLTINADGTGTETYADTSSCPNAPAAGCGVTGRVNFTLGSIMTNTAPWDTAEGIITSGGRAERGSYVSVQLVDGGKGLQLSVANGDQGFPFCKVVNGSDLNSYDCGA
jgi:hypothetical protein